MPGELDGLDGLVIPGGESTAIGADAGSRARGAVSPPSRRPILGTCAGMILLAREAVDGRPGPALARAHRPRRAPQRLRPPGRELRGRPRARRRDRAAARRLHPRAADRRGRARASRCSRRSTASRCSSAQGRIIVGGVPSRADRRTRACTSASSRSCGRRRMSGHTKWSSIKHKKGAADVKRGQLFSKLSRALIVAARDGGPDPDANIALAKRDREGARGVDAEGQHRARDRPRRGRDRRGRRLRARSTYEGYGPERRRDPRRGADRQPQPHRGRRAARLRQERRQARRDRGRWRGCSSARASCSWTPSASTRTT